MQPAPELVALLAKYYQASANSDTDFLEQLIAREPGTLIIGTDAEEWWAGGDEIVAIWGAAWKRRGGPKVAGSNPQAFREGSIGWVADQFSWPGRDGGKIGIRLSAVFREVDGQWQLLQAHFSVGVPNSRLNEFAA